MKQQLLFDDILAVDEVQQAEQSESAEPAQPAEQSESAERAQSAGQSESAEPAQPVKSGDNNILRVRQAVLGWLLQQDPSGFGVNVATRVSRYRADVAAFWSRPKNRVLVPVQTMIIEIRHAREACWPDCADRDKLLELLRAAKKAKAELEAQIRAEEPHLADDNLLFAEFCEWNYHKSRNRHYHACCRQVEKIEQAIYHGSRFDKIRSAALADFLYLAVPKGSITPAEVADGWGLLYFDDEHGVTEVLQPQPRHCLVERRQHLVQNIAAANSRSVLFQNGVNWSDGRLVFTRAPRRRRR